METELFALVVLYNKTCAGSATCRALATLQDDVAVLIYDNSTRDYGNRAWCAGKGWEYLGGEGNRGLSVAYNACIDRLKSRGEAGYLCLLGDDTALTGEYFAAQRKAAAERPEAGIFVPRIYSGGRLLSPCRKVGGAGALVCGRGGASGRAEGEMVGHQQRHGGFAAPVRRLPL